MKMKLMRTKLIFNLLISFSFYIIINASPTLNKRQDGTNLVTPKSNLLQPLKPLDATSGPVTREYQLELTRVQLTPDGFERTVWSANGQYPGPTIEANKGDRLVIHVKNNLQDNCTIHWHGIFQIGTTYFDGVTGQTQCVIKDGDTFTYNFTTGEQYGTYWWHSHYRSQYMDGLRGPLIVYDPQDPFLKEYDYEYIMTVSDWYHDHAEVLFEERTKPDYHGTNPVPDSGLISGFGRYDCSRAPPDSKCTPNAPLAVYSVEKGKRYRFRIINSSGEAPYIVSIDEHPFRIIEVEGEYVQPIVLNKLSIAIGQRYSVIVTCDKDVKNFWIRAHIVQECLDTNRVTINHDSAIDFNVTGILRYQGAPEEDPTTEDWNEPGLTCRDVDHNILELLTPRDAPGPVTDHLSFYVSFGNSDTGVPVGLINNSSFVANIDRPSVSRVFAGGDYVGKQLDPDQNAYYYDTENGVVEVILINQSGAMHPFHLHGHNFYIMGSGQGSTPDPSTYDDYPSVRDTISVPDDSWAVLRYNINNPGVWAFHCHIDWHASMGMIGQLIERPSVLQTIQLPPGICP